MKNIDLENEEFENINKLDSIEISKMIKEKSNSVKKLMMKNYNIENEINNLNNNIIFYENKIKNFKKEDDIYFKEKLRNININIDAQIKKNIDLNNLVYTTPFKNKSPLIDFIGKDFKNLLMLEFKKNEKLGSIVNSDYKKNNLEEIKSLDESLENYNTNISELKENIRNTENNIENILISLSNYKRIYKEIKKIN